MPLTFPIWAPAHCFGNELRPGGKWMCRHRSQAIHPETQKPKKTAEQQRCSVLRLLLATQKTGAPLHWRLWGPPSSPKGDESLSPVDGHGSPPLLVLLTQGHLFMERVVPAAERTGLSTSRAKNAGSVSRHTYM